MLSAIEVISQDDPPTNKPSSRVSRLAIAKDSLSLTV